MFKIFTEKFVERGKIFFNEICNDTSDCYITQNYILTEYNDYKTKRNQR